MKVNNRTLAILKPDCVEKQLIGQVITRITEAGFKVIGMKMTKLTGDSAKGFYEIHKERPFFEDLVEFMTSGPIVVAVLKKENAVEDYRLLIGSTDPEKAEEGTIRKEFAESMRANAVHGSDSDENALFESSFFFSGLQRF